MIEEACKISSCIDFRCGSAEKLPYEDNYFDIALLFAVFTSIFDLTMKKISSLRRYGF